MFQVNSIILYLIYITFFLIYIRYFDFISVQKDTPLKNEEYKMMVTIYVWKEKQNNIK